MSAPSTLNAEEIAARIPHGSSMSLLDQVTDWNPSQIRCTSRSHLQATNPLREKGELYCVALLEYAAQAAAIHANLLQTGMGECTPAFLGATKSLLLSTRLIPPIDADLIIEAHVELHNTRGAIYHFSASLKDIELAAGKLLLAQPG